MSKDSDAKIDQIVDELVADDAVAQELKSKLHQEVDQQEKVYSAPTDAAADADASDEDDDLWDNIPV